MDVGYFRSSPIHSNHFNQLSKSKATSKRSFNLEKMVDERTQKILQQKEEIAPRMKSYYSSPHLWKNKTRDLKGQKAYWK